MEKRLRGDQVADDRRHQKERNANFATLATVLGTGALLFGFWNYLVNNGQEFKNFLVTISLQ